MEAQPYKLRPVCEGTAEVTPPTATAQHKGFFYDHAHDRPVYFVKPEVQRARETWRTAIAGIRSQFSAVPEGPLFLEVSLAWPFPKSEPKWKRLLKWFPKTTKPDVDNAVKLLLDTMTAMQFWRDDSQIHRLHVTKWMAEKGMVGIRLQEVVFDRRTTTASKMEAPTLPGIDS